MYGLAAIQYCLAPSQANNLIGTIPAVCSMWGGATVYRESWECMITVARAEQGRVLSNIPAVRCQEPT